jgi:hypothetical protein
VIAEGVNGLLVASSAIFVTCALSSVAESRTTWRAFGGDGIGCAVTESDEDAEVNCDSSACAEAMVRLSATVSSCFDPAIFNTSPSLEYLVGMSIQSVQEVALGPV